MATTAAGELAEVDPEVEEDGGTRGGGLGFGRGAGRLVGRAGVRMAAAWPSMVVGGCTMATEPLMNRGHHDEVIILCSGSSSSYERDKRENSGRTHLTKLGI
ncbi:unnamed protein product [Triticum turgidum subsp. durum]|uniref:Uncharacterized protein n=1 Tax=Triticum turgidum subsp. durum TaxID=4567 RepID=A0A9R0Q2U0_TRITD|nr:unnamed protein product [Triticum turgidum subsp. durum]